MLNQCKYITSGLNCSLYIEQSNNGLSNSTAFTDDLLAILITIIQTNNLGYSLIYQNQTLGHTSELSE